MHIFGRVLCTMMVLVAGGSLPVHSQEPGRRIYNQYCATCHGLEAANYTAGGGTNHLDLIVNLALPGAGAAYVEVGAPNGSGGVNWMIGGPASSSGITKWRSV